MQRKRILGLVTMLASSVLVAFIVVSLLVYVFGQPGSYRVDQILVSPAVIKEVSVIDFDSKSGKGSHFVFNKIEFVTVDKSGKGWRRYPVTLDAYADFYHLIETLRSVTQVSDAIVNAFDERSLSTLTLFVQPQKGEKEAIFQQIDFLEEGGLFRVSTSSSEWIYFRSPGIYQKVLAFFVQE